MHKSSNKLEKVNAIKNGHGIQNLLNEAHKILENPMVMFNTEYNLLAYTDDICNDPVSSEVVAYGTFSYETQRFFMEEGFADAVANAKSIVFLLSDKIKYARILGKLFNKNKVHVANLVMVACNKPFEDEDPIAFEAVCELLSKEIIKSELYQTYGTMYQETYIRKLIDGSIDDKGIYTAHIEIIYSNLKTHLHLAVTDISRCDPQHTKLCYFRDLFKKTQPSFKYCIYANYIIILISMDDAALNVKRDLNKLFRLSVQNNIYAGISSCFENLFDLRKHYFEAVDALNYGLDHDSAQRFFLYDEIQRYF